MRVFFWDASAAIKRYFAETASDTVDAIFDEVALADMITTPWGYTETFSLLVRRRNEGVLNAANFTAAVTALQTEMIQSAAFRFLPIQDVSIFASVSVIDQHNLNATDAAILHTLLQYQQTSGDECILIACDKRLLRAAGLEGVKTINPQLVAAQDIPALLANL